jgi:phosphopantothenoylcysteine decarboxylase/phosphopantothenate--cysteine ligase
MFVEPIKGMLACGWEGEGKLQDPRVIFEEVVAALTDKDLAGEKLLITAGPTREELDPIRFLSNHSSGKMGYAIARAAYRRGAKVTLVTGPTCLEAPYGVETVCSVSAGEMREAVLRHFVDSTVIIKAAAVADYRPGLRADKKIKKSDKTLTLTFVKNPDILSELAKLKEERVLVGFAAETDNLAKNAGKKLVEKNLDMVVANDVSQAGAGFDVDTNRVTLLLRDGSEENLPLMQKEELADVILDRVAALLRKRNGL